MRRVSSDGTNKPQGDTMLKKIALVGFLALTTAFVGVGAVSAHTSATAAKKVVVPAAPQGFCWPTGTPC
jgi:hypothetical protein